MTNKNNSNWPQDPNQPIDNWEMDDWQSAGWPGETQSDTQSDHPNVSAVNTSIPTSNTAASTLGDQEDSPAAMPELQGRITSVQPGSTGLPVEDNRTTAYPFATPKESDSHQYAHIASYEMSAEPETNNFLNNGFGREADAPSVSENQFPPSSPYESAHTTFEGSFYNQTPYQPASVAGQFPQSGQGTWEPSPMPEKSKEKSKRGPGWLATIAIAVTASLACWGLVAYMNADNTTSLGTSQSKIATQAPVVQASGKATDWETVAKTVQPSVVAIQVASGSSGETGSGVIFDQAGHVITNYHVVAAAITGNSKVQITLHNGKIYDAQVVGADASTDLAVLKFTNPPKTLEMASLGSSTDLRVAQPVAAIGSPLGLENTVTTGIISALDRPVAVTQSSGEKRSGIEIPGLHERSGSGQQVVTNAIQVDAAINPGNSGGPLFNASGQVIGITSSIASLGSNSSGQSGSIGIGFAIPVNLVKNVADQILKTGKVTHAVLGVTIKTGIAKVAGESQVGAAVEQVVPGSAADKAGLKSGDLITKIDKHDISSGTALTGYVRWYKPGDQVTLTLLRSDGEHQIKVTLGAESALQR